MNINDFKDEIDKKILNRGYDYYVDGNVIEAYTKDGLEYIFQIQGSEDYEVVVNINKNKDIISSYCDCPYDFGPICKHEVASFFELQDVLSRPQKNKKRGKKQTFNEILNDLSKDELIKLLIEVTNKDKSLKREMEFKYSKCSEEQELKKCKEFMQSVVNKYIKKYDFIHYNVTYKFIEELYPILHKANDTSNIILSIDIDTMLLTECIKSFEYADDSNGEIGNFIEEIIANINENVTGVKEHENYLIEEVFNKLINYIDNSIFEVYEEYKIDILNICTTLCDNDKLRNILMRKLEYLLETGNDSEYNNYFKEYLLKIMFYIIEEYKTKEEATKFIEKNIEYSTFRKLLINRYIDKGDYNKVIEITLDGEEKDKEYRGLLKTWKEIRYDAYEKLSLKEEQKKLAKELFFDGDFDYYKKLKALEGKENKLFYENLKQELKQGNYRLKSVYIKLVEEENDVDELMELTRQSRFNIERYAPILINKFETEITEIYQDHIKEHALMANDRRGYNRVCKIIKKYGDVTGSKNKIELIIQLENLNKKRPAFIDELSKVK